MTSPIQRTFNKLKRLKLIDLAYAHTLPEIEHLKRLLDYLNVDLIIDVGANAGQYATRLRKQIGYKGTIVSVEPLPEMIEHLEDARKNDDNWHIEPIVVSDRCGEQSFNVTVDRQCSSLANPSASETSLFATQTAVTRVISVRSELLDTVLERWLSRGNFRRPFLKLDTQGHDLAIVKACSQLRHFVGIQSELSIKRLYQGTPTFTESINYYCSLGFEISAFVPNNSIGFPQLIELDCIMIRSDFITMAGA